MNEWRNWIGGKCLYDFLRSFFQRHPQVFQSANIWPPHHTALWHELLGFESLGCARFRTGTQGTIYYNRDSHVFNLTTSCLVRYALL